MNYQELEQAYLESQKEVFQLRAANDALRNGQHWCDITGSSHELASATTASATMASAGVAITQRPECGQSSEPVGQLAANMRNYEANVRLVASGFRQIKYELYCATVDLLGFSLHVAPGRNCIATSVYDLQSGGSEFEFIYDAHEHKYVDLLWSEAMEAYTEMYQYWIEENHCIQGFMASVFLDKYARRGQPPARERRVPVEL